MQAIKDRIDAVNNRIIHIGFERKTVAMGVDKGRIELRQAKAEAAKTDAALEMVRTLSADLRSGLERRLRSVATKALRSVTGGDGMAHITFEERGGRPSVDIAISSDGKTPHSPKYGKGGGVGDVVALGLRMAVWSMMAPRPRPLFVLDEPMRFVSKEYQPIVSGMLKAMAGRAGVQFIVVTHQRELEESADKVLTVSINRKGESHVSE